MDLNKAIDISKILLGLTSRFGVNRINRALKLAKEYELEVSSIDNDELIDWVGNYFMEYRNYEPAKIRDEDELLKFILAVVSYKELRNVRGISGWDLKKRYLYNNHIDINSIDIEGVDLEENFDELSHLAYWGHIKAIEEIASFYASPAGGSKDQLCVKYWYRAAELGSADSQERLARLYFSEARGLKFDAKKVIHYYKCAAIQGNEKAMSFVNRFNIDLNSPTISQEEINRVIEAKYAKRESTAQEKEEQSSPLVKVLSYIWIIIFWGYVIYEFVLN